MKLFCKRKKQTNETPVLKIQSTVQVHPFDQISEQEWMKKFNIGKQYTRFKAKETF